MQQSERLQRMCDGRYDLETRTLDENLSNRIILLLNNPNIDKYCMVDAYYYDFSVIPRGIQGKLQLWRDCYLIFGITTEGDVVSKWVDRWDLDSDEPIVDGVVERQNSEKLCEVSIPPKINMCFDPKLLSTPNSDFIQLFTSPN